MAQKSTTLRSLRAREAAQVPPRLGVRIVAVFVALQLLLLAALVLLFPAKAGAAPVKGELSVTTASGYARLVFTLAEETEADVRLANGILIIAFKQAVDVPVDRIATAGVELCERRAARSRRRRRPHRAQPQGHRQHHGGGREAVRRSAARGLDRPAAGPAAGGRRGAGPARARSGKEGAGAAARLAATPAAAGARARRRAADLHALHLRPAGADSGLDRAPRRQADHDVRGAAALRSRRRAGRAAADDRLGRLPSPERTSRWCTSSSSARWTCARSARTTTTSSMSSRSDRAPTASRKPRPVLRRSRRSPRSAAAALRRRRRPAPCRRQTGRSRKASAKSAEAAGSRKARGSRRARVPTSPLRPRQASSRQRVRRVARRWTRRAGPERRPRRSRRARMRGRRRLPTRRRRWWSTSRRQGDAVRLTFPFAAPTPAAMFRRGDTIWLVFDSQAPIDIGKIAAQSGRSIRNATVDALARGPGGAAQARSAEAHQRGHRRHDLDGDRRRHDARADAAARHGAADASGGRTSVSIPFQEPRQLHRLADAEVGDTLLVVTALGPARGFLKPQEFVEFNALVSTHGVVIQPLADDVSAELRADKVVVTRPGGLTLSSAGARPSAAPQVRGTADAARHGLGRLHARSAGLGLRSRVRTSATGRST